MSRKIQKLTQPIHIVLTAVGRAHHHVGLSCPGWSWCFETRGTCTYTVCIIYITTTLLVLATTVLGYHHVVSRGPGTNVTPKTPGITDNLNTALKKALNLAPDKEPLRATVSGGMSFGPEVSPPLLFHGKDDWPLLPHRHRKKNSFLLLSLKNNRNNTEGSRRQPANSSLIVIFVACTIILDIGFHITVRCVSVITEILHVLS